MVWTLVGGLLCGMGVTMSMNDEQKLRITNLLKRVSVLKEDKEKLKQHRQELMGRNEELQRSKVALTVDLGETVKKLEVQATVLAAEKTKSDSLAARLAEVDAALVSARQSNETLTGQISTLERERDSLKKDISSLYTVATTTKSQVTLIEFDSQLRADAVLQRKLHSLPNVKVITSALTTEVLGNGEKVSGLRYKDRTTDELHDLALEGIFVQIGLLPNTDWLKGTVELSPRGEIIVDAKGATNIPGVFAAGDVTTVPYKQIVIAVGEGAKASLAAFDHLIRASAPA